MIIGGQALSSTALSVVSDAGSVRETTSVGPSIISSAFTPAFVSPTGPSVINTAEGGLVWTPRVIRGYAVPLGPSGINPAAYVRPHITTPVGPSRFGLPRSRLLTLTHAASPVGPSDISPADSEVLYNYVADPVDPSQVNAPVYLVMYPHAALTLGQSRIGRAEGPMPPIDHHAVSVLRRENKITVRN